MLIISIHKKQCGKPKLCKVAFTKDETMHIAELGIRGLTKSLNLSFGIHAYISLSGQFRKPQDQKNCTTNSNQDSLLPPDFLNHLTTESIPSC